MEVALPIIILLAIIPGGLILSALGIMIGGRIAGVRTGFWKSVLAVILLGLASVVINIPASAFLEPVISFVLGVVVSLVILKTIFKTAWGPALIMWLLSGVAFVIGAMIIGILVVIILPFSMGDIVEQVKPYLPGQGVEISMPWLWIWRGGI